MINLESTLTFYNGHACIVWKAQFLIAFSRYFSHNQRRTFTCGEFVPLNFVSDQVSIHHVDNLPVSTLTCVPFSHLRRRTVPLVRPHSWHLAKLSELPLPPPPPPPSPPLPCLASADSPPFPPPPPPSAMQLHPSPYTLPWHTTDNRWESITQINIMILYFSSFLDLLIHYQLF